MLVSSCEAHPTGRGSERWMNRWKPALNAFAVTFEGRFFSGGSMTTASIAYTVIPTIPLTGVDPVAGHPSMPRKRPCVGGSWLLRTRRVSCS